jgi:hypothetical protein
MNKEQTLNIDEELVNQAEEDYEKGIEEVVIPVFDEDGIEYYPGWTTPCLDCFEPIDNPYDMCIPFCKSCELKRYPIKQKQLNLFDTP